MVDRDRHNKCIGNLFGKGVAGKEKQNDKLAVLEKRTHGESNPNGSITNRELPRRNITVTNLFTASPTLVLHFLLFPFHKQTRERARVLFLLF